ncbi:MAG: hypothetical protein R3246_05815, partial [Acidimicrobiia bacterium]|nr:hypothetical protein [Acidimicrobiia bacterium]
MLFPGPPQLGRGIVVVGAPPAAYADAPVTRIDSSVTTDEHRLALTVDRLHRFWAARTPHVVVLETDNDALRRPETTTAAPWELG